MTGEAHWHVLNRARAIENTAFRRFVLRGRARSDGGGESYGHSLVVSPWGEVLADGSGIIPGVIHAQLDLDLVEAPLPHAFPALAMTGPIPGGWRSVERNVA